MWLQSRSMALQRPGAARAPRASSGRSSTCAPIARAASTKRMSPWIESAPTPSMRSGRVGRRDRAERDEVATPTRRRLRHGCRRASGSGCPAGMVKRCQPSRCTAMPKRCQQLQRDLDVGLGDQLAVDLDHDRAARAAASGSASSSAVRNWLETSPRTRIGCVERAALPGRPDAQRRIAVVAQVVDCAAELAQRVDQVADRPLVHARARRAARSSPPSAAPGRARGQRAHRRAGVAEEQRRRCCAGAPAAEAGDRRAPSPSRFDAAAELRAARRASPACRRNRAGRGRRWCRRSGRPAAARGWRCSWSRAARTVPAALRSGGRSRNVGRRTSAGLGAAALSVVAGVAVMLPAARGLRWRCGSGLRAPRRCRASITCSIASSAWRKRCDCFSDLFAVGHQDVAPDRRGRWRRCA